MSDLADNCEDPTVKQQLEQMIEQSDDVIQEKCNAPAPTPAAPANNNIFRSNGNNYLKKL